MTQGDWFVKYESVDAPTKSRRGWKYPYNGDDWPVDDNWYWVWTSKPGRSPDSIFALPRIAWWDKKKQKFLAQGDREIYAWRKAVKSREALEVAK